MSHEQSNSTEPSMSAVMEMLLELTGIIRCGVCHGGHTFRGSELVAFLLRTTIAESQEEALSFASTLLKANMFNAVAPGKQAVGASAPFSANSQKYRLTGLDSSKFVTFSREPHTGSSVQIRHFSNVVHIDRVAVHGGGQIPYLFVHENNFADQPRCGCLAQILTVEEGSLVRHGLTFTLTQPRSLFFAPALYDHEDLKQLVSSRFRRTLLCAPAIEPLCFDCTVGEHVIQRLATLPRFYPLGRKNRFLPSLRARHRKESSCPATTMLRRVSDNFRGGGTDLHRDSSDSAAHRDSSVSQSPTTSSSPPPPSQPPHDTRDSGFGGSNSELSSTSPRELSATATHTDESISHESSLNEGEDEDDELGASRPPSPIERQGTGTSVTSSTATSLLPVLPRDMGTRRTLLRFLTERFRRKAKKQQEAGDTNDVDDDDDVDDAFAPEIMTNEDDGTLEAAAVSAPIGMSSKDYKHYRKEGWIHVTWKYHLIDETGTNHADISFTSRVVRDPLPPPCTNCLEKRARNRAMNARSLSHNSSTQATLPSANRTQTCSLTGLMKRGLATASSTSVPSIAAQVLRPKWKTHFTAQIEARNYAQTTLFEGLVNMQERLMAQWRNKQHQLSAGVESSVAFSEGSSTGEDSQASAPSNGRSGGGGRKTARSWIRPEELMTLKRRVLSMKDGTKLRRVGYIESFDGLRLLYHAFEQRNRPQASANVVLVSSIAVGFDWLLPTAEELAGDHNFNVYLLMLRGHGGSEGPPGFTPSKQALLYDIRSLVRHVKWNVAGESSGSTEPGRTLPLFVAGHSSGASLVFRYGVWPEREPVDGYTIAAPYFKEFLFDDKKTQTTADKLLIRINKLSHGHLLGNVSLVDVRKKYQQEIGGGGGSGGAAAGKGELDLGDFPHQLSVNLVAAIMVHNVADKFMRLDRRFALILAEDDELFDAQALAAVARRSPVSSKTVEIVEGTTQLSILPQFAELLAQWIRSSIK